MAREDSQFGTLAVVRKGEAIEAIAATCVAGAKGRPGKRAAKGCARLYVLRLSKR